MPIEKSLESFFAKSEVIEDLPTPPLAEAMAIVFLMLIKENF